jgi:galactonate dehydratase
MTRLTRVQPHVFNVSDKTNWFFIAVQTDDGAVAWGEASLNGCEPALDAATHRARALCVGLTLEEAHARVAVDANAPEGLAANAVASAIQQALLGLTSAQRSVPIHTCLGPLVRSEVAAYANINRATTERTPQGFVATALRAQCRGFLAFKAAPFDGVTPGHAGSREGQRLIRHGIDCLLALRDALGPAARIMVDCHWRFDEASALDALRALAPARLHWFECPLPETAANWPALRRIRAAAREQGVLLAAGETQVGVAAFQTLFDEALYDVVMPDVKYCGGPREMLAIAERAADAGVRFSPHNPTGPVCTQYSLHVAGVAPQCEGLEMQFDESPLYEALVMQGLPLLVDGAIAVPSGPGLGLALDETRLAAHPYQPVPLGIESIGPH